MSTQLDVSHVGELVDSLTEHASSALASFEVVKSDVQRVQAQPANDSRLASPWFQPLPAQPKSILGKGGTFALVAAAHVLVFFGMANLPQSIRERITAPLQVVSIVEEQVTNDLPPPPKPQVQNFDVPVEPIVLDIADPDSMAITVRAQPQEAVAAPQTPTTVQPKMVSSVEYVREPAAKYPAAARALKQRGVVTLRVLIDAAGRAREVTVHRSSGHKLLDDAGRKAVLDGVYKPYTENGHALSVYVLIPIEFSVA